MSFGALRIINEDRVEPSTGFGLHTHREMEIFSYLVSGELEQYVCFPPTHDIEPADRVRLCFSKDSMGNIETLKRGDLQMTSAGTGISHSEYNRNDEHVRTTLYLRILK